MISNVLHHCGKRVFLPIFVLSLVLVGILSNMMKVSFSFLQNNKPHSKRCEGKGYLIHFSFAELSQQQMALLSFSTWSTFVYTNQTSTPPLENHLPLPIHLSHYV